MPNEMSHDVFWPQTFPSLRQEAEAFEKQHLPPGGDRDAAVCSLSRACMRATWRIAKYLKWEKKFEIAPRNNLDGMEKGLLKRGLDYIEELYSILDCWKRSLLLSATDVELSTNTQDRARGIDNLCVEYQLLADCIIKFQMCGWINDEEMIDELVWVHSSTVLKVLGADEHLLKMRDIEDAHFEARLCNGSKIWDEKKRFGGKIRVLALWSEVTVEE
jgi:hypothetical protein